ncbi:MAG: 7-cyano-7-deazaguanine synthase QueC [Fibrobacterota bacterium]
MANAIKALVVFSGGQDSTTCLYWALDKFGKGKVMALSFDYGQRHKRELACAKKIAQQVNVPHYILPINTFAGLGNNSLTGTLTVTNSRGKRGLPNTFVPGRNLIFLTFAAAFAYTHNIRHLVTGVCEADYSGYPDCRKKTMAALEKAISLGMEYPIRIHTPLIHKSKAAAVRMLQKLGGLPALAHSHTCYNNAFPPCGKCNACVLRARAFQQAGVPDPLLTIKDFFQVRKKISTGSGGRLR